MALSYQTYWDTCQYLDSPTPTTPSFSLPDLMDIELQQSLSFDQNTPCLDSIFDNNTPKTYNHLHIDTSSSFPEFEPNLYQYSYPYQSQPVSKLFTPDNFADFSTLAEKLPEFHCQVPLVSKHSPSDFYTDFSTSVEKLPEVQIQCPVMPLSKRSRSGYYVDFSASVEKLAAFQCQVPPVFGVGSGNGSDGSDGTLSAQSVAARQRRRKIMEKTQELGKLVPGGNKMNTAEMFGAAYKYIKFLQTQVGILQLLESTQEIEVAQLSHCEQLQNLATSTKIREKLYSNEKCLVPNQFIESISRDVDFQKSNPVIIKDINQLIRKSGYQIS